MDQADIPYLSVTELSRLMERREVSPVEATEAYLDRIDDLDFKFNSYLTVCRKEAIQAAQEAERAIGRGNYLGPMHGIPVAVLDNLQSRGIRSTGGSRLFADFKPDEDATAIANLKKAGAILLGKTNLAELHIGGGQSYSTPRNPWNLDMYTGSASGGSAAATAALLCATSLGEDTGGASRQPAAYCGLVGLRPSWGRVSRYGFIRRGIWSMDTIAPISRKVEDAAITLGTIAGYDPKDAYSWSTPVPDYRRALDGNIKGMWIGVITDQVDTELMEPGSRDAVGQAVAQLAKLGASVEKVDLPLARHAMTITIVLLRVETALTHRHWIRERLRDYSRPLQLEHLAGSIIPAQVYYKAQKLRSMLWRQVHEALEKYDVLVLPTVTAPAGRIEPPPVSPGDGKRQRPLDRPTSIFSLASSPAISVPCGFNSQGLPVGLQIGGRPGAEETVLKLAYAYEQNTAWHTMRPPGV